jgi:ketosteroid isomerase-like protein
MKKFALFITSVLLLSKTAFAGECPTAFPKPAKLSKNEKIVWDIYESLKQNDLKAFFSVLSDDVEWTFEAPKSIVAFGGTYHGKQGVMESFGNMSKFKSDYLWPLKSMTKGNTVVIILNECLTEIATGKQIHHHPVAVFELNRDGKINKFNVFSNMSAFIH